jgi:hyperosmotically inducible protein
MSNANKWILGSTVGALLGITSLTGCQTWGHRGDSERTAGRMVDDAKITADVQRDLKKEPVYKFSDVDVKAFNGVVQLSGFVNTDEQKRRAGEIAQQAPGVAQVVNNISLKPQVTPTGREQGAPPAGNQSAPPPR